jgi:hypothetical protein
MKNFAKNEPLLVLVRIEFPSLSLSLSLNAWHCEAKRESIPHF